MAENFYWEEIERYFAKKRGHALILSPKDWPLVTSWQERGIPLEVIYQGIDQAFARLEEKQRTSRRQPIRTLTACQSAVEELWHARKEAVPAASQFSQEGLQQAIMTERRHLATKISGVSSQLRKYAQTPHYLCLKNELLAASETLEALTPFVAQTEDAEALAHIKQKIRRIEQHLLAQLEQAIAPVTRQELSTKAEAQLAAYKKHMNADVYQETLRIAFLQGLREVYPLPSFL